DRRARSIVISTNVSIVLDIYSTYTRRIGWYKNNGILSKILAIMVPLLSMIGLIEIYIEVNNDIDQCRSSDNSLQSWGITCLLFVSDHPMLESCADDIGINGKDILRLVKNHSNKAIFCKLADKYQISVEELKNRLNRHEKLIL
ncbi:3575_t:CDS:2, partial [Racocetra persica]